MEIKLQKEHVEYIKERMNTLKELETKSLTLATQARNTRNVIWDYIREHYKEARNHECSFSIEEGTLTVIRPMSIEELISSIKVLIVNKPEKVDKAKVQVHLKQLNDLLVKQAESEVNKMQIKK